MLGTIEGGRRRGRQRMRWSDSTINSMDTNLSKLQGIAKDRAWSAAVHGVTKSRTQLSACSTTTNACFWKPTDFMLFEISAKSFRENCEPLMELRDLNPKQDQWNIQLKRTTSGRIRKRFKKDRMENSATYKSQDTSEGCFSVSLVLD